MDNYSLVIKILILPLNSKTMRKKPVTILEYSQYFVYCQKKLVGLELQQETIKIYTSRHKKLQVFLEENKLSTLKPQAVSIHFIREYSLYLRVEKKLCTPYAMKCVQYLDRLLRLSMENGDITTNPATLFEYKYQREAKIIYLQRSDLITIKKLTLNINYHWTRNIFLFGCYTGLSFSDILNFNYEQNIFIGPDNRKWIHIKRKKNGTDTYLPLLPEAEEILKYYYYKIPKKSIQKVNKGLKVIAKKAKIVQPLTSHVARKTFGNIMHNELNISIETVSKMLGHKSVKTTESWYVRTNVHRIASDMKNINFYDRTA
jgi:integrase